MGGCETEESQAEVLDEQSETFLSSCPNINREVSVCEEELQKQAGPRV